jgi:oxygen-dependent protoporphyrinogen oxidase
MFEGRAPEGHVSISCYVGGARNTAVAGMPASDMVDLVSGELSGVLGIKGPPVISCVRHWARGLPQYNLGHIERRRVMESASERLPGLILTGNYMWGVSIANCLASARAAGRQEHGLPFETDVRPSRRPSIA